MLQSSLNIVTETILIMTLQSPPLFFEKIFDSLKTEFSKRKVQAVHISETLAFSHLLNCARSRHVIKLKGPREEVENLIEELHSKLLGKFQDCTQYRIIDWKLKRLQDFDDSERQTDHPITQRESNRFNSERRNQLCKLTRAIAGNRGLRHSFEWGAGDYIQFLRQNETGSVYRAIAVHVSTTLNNLTFTEDELRLAARSLGNRPLNLNHKRDLDFPANRVIDARFEDDAVECLIAVSDPAIINMIENKQITAVSIEAKARACEQICNEDKWSTHPKGVVLTGLALLTPGVLPGDPLARIIMKQKGHTDQKHSPASDSHRRTAEPTTRRSKLGLFWSGIFTVIAAILATALITSAVGKARIDYAEAEKIARRHLRTRDVKDVVLIDHHESSHCYGFQFARGSRKFTVRVDKVGKIIGYKEGYE